jgi:polysaccharide export outer membrane protein
MDGRRRWIPTLVMVLLLGALAGVAGAQPAPDYQVGPRDVLDIVVFGQADLSARFTVGADGAFTFPLIGDVKAVGLTAREIESAIRARLAEGFLREPQVSVRVAEYQSQRVFVVGEVGLPGAVPLTGALTLVEALAKAGGLGKDAGTEIVILRRDETQTAAAGPLMQGQAGVTEVARIALDDLQSGQARENVALRDGDTIFIPKGEQVFVLGQVNSPGPVPYTRDLTVFKALSLAGGVTQLGSAGRARIVRIVNGERKETKAKMTDLLQPGDTLMVPTRWF